MKNFANSISQPHLFAANVADIMGWTCLDALLNTNRKGSFSLTKSRLTWAGGEPVPFSFPSYHSCCLIWLWTKREQTSCSNKTFQRCTQTCCCYWHFAGLMTLRKEAYIGVRPRQCAVEYDWKCASCSLPQGTESVRARKWNEVLLLTSFSYNLANVQSKHQASSHGVKAGES